MKQKHLHFNLVQRIISILIIVAMVGVAAVILVGRDSPQAVAAPDAPTATSSPFSFEVSTASGWRKGPGNETSLAVFKNDHTCFASIAWGSDGVTEASWQQNIGKDWAGSGYTGVKTGSETLALKVGATSLGYQLQRYSVTTPAGVEKVYDGQAFGYVPLSDGYLTVQAYCDTAEQLAGVMPALAALHYTTHE